MDEAPADGLQPLLHSSVSHPELRGYVASARTTEAHSQALEDECPSSDQSRAKFERRHDRLKQTRERTVATRFHVYQKRNQVRTLQSAFSEVQAAFMKQLQNDLSITGFSQGLKTELGLLYDKLESARNALGPMQDEYSQLEDQLNEQEYRFSRAEEHFSRRYKFDKTSTWRLRTLSNVSSATPVEYTMERAPPAVEEYLGRLGDVELLKETLEMLEAERYNYVHQEELRKDIRQRYKDDQEFQKRATEEEEIRRWLGSPEPMLTGDPVLDEMDANMADLVKQIETGRKELEELVENGALDLRSDEGSPESVEPVRDKDFELIDVGSTLPDVGSTLTDAGSTLIDVGSTLGEGNIPVSPDSTTFCSELLGESCLSEADGSIALQDERNTNESSVAWPIEIEAEKDFVRTLRQFDNPRQFVNHWILHVFRISRLAVCEYIANTDLAKLELDQNSLVYQIKKYWFDDEAAANVDPLVPDNGDSEEDSMLHVGDSEPPLESHVSAYTISSESLQEELPLPSQSGSSERSSKIEDASLRVSLQDEPAAIRFLEECP
ncbi:MAG: hypothetical protein M4579_004466 [Chaenotheca gracillima]|nr:MAG: hypothetical protein M4579_004466 [Chaenotheca gracillima]